MADAMGNAGQRMLSTVARAPGEGRTAVVQALDARQGDQGRRLPGPFGMPLMRLRPQSKRALEWSRMPILKRAIITPP